MNPTCKSLACRRIRIRSRLTLLMAPMMGLAHLANASDDSALRALQQQLEQVQATLQQLADENRALREHQQELDRRVAELTAAGAGPASQALPPARGGRGAAASVHTPRPAPP